MILNLIFLPLIIFIPGFLLCKLFVKDKLSIDFFETIFINILASLLISGWIGLILAELGYFSLQNLIIGLLIFSSICIILILKFKRNLSFKNLLKPKINYKSVILVIILLAAAKLFFPPGENITLNQDDVVIVNHGVNIAETGNIFGRDPLLNEVKHKNLFYDFQSQKLQFPDFGFYMNLKTNQIEFQYLDFYPVLLAVFYSLFGIRFFLYLTPLLALLAVISVYITAKHMFSWEVGILSSLFLTFSFPQIWFARYPCAEILTQLFMFSGLFMIILLLKYKKPFFAFFSGFIFSTLMLVRLDSLFTALAFAVFVILFQLTGILKHKNILVLSFSFLIPNSWALMHNYMFDKSYVFIPSKFLLFIKNVLGAGFQNLHVTSFLLFYGFPAFLLLVSILFIRHSSFIPKLYQHINDSGWKKICYVSPFLIAVPFIILYITRYPYSKELIGPKQTLLIIQSFLTPVGLLLSIIGLIIIINQHLLNVHFLKYEKSLPILCFILIALPHLVYYVFLSLHNQPVLPWGFRRYVPIIFPFLIICLSFILIRIFHVSKPQIRLKSIIPKIVSIGLVCFLFVSMLIQNLDSDILNHREFEGLIKETKLFSTYFERKSIILFYPNSYLTGISVPLKYIFHKKTILLPKLEASDDFFRQIALWKSKNRPVYIATNKPNEVKKCLLENCQLVPYLKFKIVLQKMKYVEKPKVGTELYGNILKEEQVLYAFEIQSPIFYQRKKIP